MRTTSYYTAREAAAFSLTGLVDRLQIHVGHDPTYAVLQAEYEARVARRKP